MKNDIEKQKTDKEIWLIDWYTYLGCHKKQVKLHLLLNSCIHRETHTKGFSALQKEFRKCTNGYEKKVFCMNTLLLSSNLNSSTDPVKKECERRTMESSCWTIYGMTLYHRCYFLIFLIQNDNNENNFVIVIILEMYWRIIKNINYLFDVRMRFY